MSDKQQPVEFSKEVLDQRNDLTAPDDAAKGSYPKRTEHVSIEESNRNKSK